MRWNHETSSLLWHYWRRGGILKTYPSNVLCQRESKKWQTSYSSWCFAWAGSNNEEAYWVLRKWIFSHWTYFIKWLFSFVVFFWVYCSNFPLFIITTSSYFLTQFGRFYVTFANYSFIIPSQCCYLSRISLRSLQISHSFKIVSR